MPASKAAALILNQPAEKQPALDSGQAIQTDSRSSAVLLWAAPATAAVSPWIAAQSLAELSLAVARVALLSQSWAGSESAASRSQLVQSRA